jgi:SAM-dependent methyltransferase
MSDVYPSGFFEQIALGCERSADVVVPMIRDLVRPASVIDVGCGQGIWLREFKRSGVSRIFGIDGEYVDPRGLVIDRAEFMAADLEKPLPKLGSFDLALCLEVAEHVSSEIAESLVNALTTIAPVVAFSAAIPGQRGTHHVNEQWPEYWARLFQERDYLAFDPIRPRIRGNPSVELWYRQNLVLYAARGWAAWHPEMKASLVEQPVLLGEWVHRAVYEFQLSQATRGD